MIAGYFIILFAIGYKFDFIDGKFVKTGSFQVKANVPFEVYGNDSLIGRSSFLTNRFAQKRLLPRTYSVRIENSSRQTWRKDVKIDAGVFVDFPSIVLVPRELEETKLADLEIDRDSKLIFSPEADALLIFSQSKTKTEGQKVNLSDGLINQLTVPEAVPPPAENQKEVTNKNLSPDGQKAFLLNNNEISINWLKDSGQQPFKKAGDRELITRFSEKIAEVQWYKDSEHLLVQVGQTIKFIEIDTRGGVNIFDLSASERPFYYDSKKDILYFVDGKTLKRLTVD